MTEEDELLIYMIKTDAGCFISDIEIKNGRRDRYQRSRIKELFFDGIKPEDTYLNNWLRIDSYPRKVQRKEADKQINKMWVLRNPDMESKALPLRLKEEELDYEDTTYDLYKLSYKTVPGELVDIPHKIEIILEVENFKLPPVIDYIYNEDRRGVYKVTHADVEHQMLDKLIIPEVVLHEYPCKLSSKDMYRIVRYHIKNNIDMRYARITSDYDFCFTVKKKAELIGPGKIKHSATSDSNFEVSDDIETFREFDVFEMTHDKENYRGYTPIRGISARNQHELKEKIENYLKELMEHINAPTVEYETGRQGLWKNLS